MNIQLFNKQTQLVIEDKKNSLYFINSTLRQPERLLNFLSLFNTLKEIKTIWSFNDFFCAACKEYPQESYDEKTPHETYTRRFKELMLLGLIKYSENTKNSTIILEYIDIDYLDSFLPLAKTTNDSIQEREKRSTFILSLLKKRNTLDFVTQLIIEVENLWINQNKGKRKGVSNIELIFCYKISPIMEQQKKLNVQYFAKQIILMRNLYKIEKKKVHNLKLKYIDFLKSRAQIKENRFLSYLEHLNKNKIETEKIKISIRLWETIKEYIDVTTRTLRITDCFQINNKFLSKSITINPFFTTKLNYFLENNYNHIRTKIIQKEIERDLYSHEIKEYKSQNKNIVNPINFRYEREIQNRLNFYIDKRNKDEEKKEINSLLDFFKEDPSWYIFEHLINCLASFYLKYHLKQQLTTKNINYAIKLDSEGNYGNSTTSGVEDFSYLGTEFNLIIESSRLSGLIARKNEGPAVKLHAENIYKKNKNVTLVLIVLENQISNEFQQDYLETNLFNISISKPIYYLPLSFKQFKDNFYNTDRNIHVLEIIKELQEKINIENINKNQHAQYQTFSNLNLEKIIL